MPLLWVTWMPVTLPSRWSVNVTLTCGAVRSRGSMVGGLPVLRHAVAQQVGIRAELIAERGIVPDAHAAAPGQRIVLRS